MVVRHCTEKVVINYHRKPGENGFMRHQVSKCESEASRPGEKQGSIFMGFFKLSRSISRHLLLMLPHCIQEKN